MNPMQNVLKFTDRIIKYLANSAERKTTRASKSEGHVISFLIVFWSIVFFISLLWNKNNTFDVTVSRDNHKTVPRIDDSTFVCFSSVAQFIYFFFG